MIKSNKTSGFLFGLLSSACFGLIPLFTLPVMHKGMTFESILLYRFIFACTAIAVMMFARKESFRIQLKNIPSLLLLALLYDMSALFLFWGYEFMSSGVATTIHFTYPVLTTLIMMVFFKEKKSAWRFIAIALAVIGVFLLSYGDTSGQITPTGLFIVLLSALGYALYLATISQLRSRKMRGLPFTFYVFLFGTLFLLAGIETTGNIQPITDLGTVGYLFLLALIPTVLANLALVKAIKSIGSTLSSVLGAMEPVTAVCVGILVFGEAFTGSIGVGIALIISAVIIIILKR